jgi:hypothetical protein
MSSRIASILLVVAAVACGGNAKPAPAAPSDETVAAPTTSPPAAETSPRADGRPAIVTDEMVALADDMMVAMTAMGTELAAAGTDCARGAAVMRSANRTLAPLTERSKAFDEPMRDPAAEAWFKETYMPRLMAAMQPLMTMAQSCSNDPDFTAAMQELTEDM